MRFYLGCLVFGALIALSLAAGCKDASECTNVMTCNVQGEIAGCKDHVCTCVTAPKSCLIKADCGGAAGTVDHCTHDPHGHPHGHKDWHCVDGFCQCVEIKA